MSKLQTTVNEYFGAAFTGLWLRTVEPVEVEMELYQLGLAWSYEVLFWDCVFGISDSPRPDAISPADEEPDPLSGEGGPMALLPALLQQLARLSAKTEDGQVTPRRVLVLRNLHLFCDPKRSSDAAKVVQAIQLLAPVMEEEQGNIVAVVPPSASIPEELERLFVPVNHELPTRDELWEVMHTTWEANHSEDVPLKLAEAGSDEAIKLADAAAGMTRQECVTAVSLSFLRHNAVQPDVLWQLKAETIRKSGALSLYHKQGSFDKIGGLEGVKTFCLQAFANKDDGVHPRGVVLLGPPGTGKSEFAKALGAMVGRPTLCLDVGSLMGSLVGQTEERTRAMLRVVDAMAPCILFVDELEKALSGTGGGNDSGVGSRMLGALLTWLNDHESDVFFIGTSNDMARLPSAFTRAERFDGIFFMDLPTKEGRNAIWEIHRKGFGIDPGDGVPDDMQWTGAEIKSCCRLAKLFGLSLKDTAKYVVPVAKTGQEDLQKLRKWATNRCLDAETGAVYTGAKQTEKPQIPRRKTKLATGAK